MCDSVCVCVCSVGHCAVTVTLHFFFPKNKENKAILWSKNTRGYLSLWGAFLSSKTDMRICAHMHVVKSVYVTWGWLKPDVKKKKKKPFLFNQNIFGVLHTEKWSFQERKAEMASLRLFPVCCSCSESLQLVRSNGWLFSGLAELLITPLSSLWSN